MKVFRKYAFTFGAVLLTGLYSPQSWSQFTPENPVAETVQEAAPSGPTLEEKLEQARNGDLDTQISLARDYLTGSNNTPKQPVDAARWLTAASEKGNAEAQFLLANLLREGAEGLKANKKNAVTLYASAADKGHAEAAYWAGDAYHYGNGVKIAATRAVEYYGKAADLGHVASKNNLGLMYLQGKGVDRDLKTAFLLFSDTAKTGDSWGQNNLGGMYEMGWGTVKNADTALALYEKSAAAGNVHGASNMIRLRAVMSVKVEMEAAKQQTDTVPSAGVIPEPGTEQKPEPVLNEPSGNPEKSNTTSTN